MPLPGLFNSYQLISDIISTPQNFLNGTAAYNVTGCINSCVFALNESTSGPADCYITNGTARDSFLWCGFFFPVCSEVGWLTRRGQVRRAAPERADGPRDRARDRGEHREREPERVHHLVHLSAWSKEAGLESVLSEADRTLLYNALLHGHNLLFYII